MKIRAIIMECTVEEAYAIGYMKNKVSGIIEPLREAEYFRYLHEVKKMSADHIAEKFGVTSRRVYQILSRTKGAEPLKKIYETGFTGVVREQKLEPWHYELLGSIKEPQKQELLAKMIIEQGLSREEAQIAKEAIEKGLPQEAIDKVIVAAKGEKLGSKRARKVAEPKIVERITIPPTETFKERPAEPQLLKTEDEFEETKEQKTGGPVFEIITCPKCGTKAKVEWGAKKITWG